MSRPLMWVGVAYTLGVIWAAGDQKALLRHSRNCAFCMDNRQNQTALERKTAVLVAACFFSVSGFVIFDHAMTDVKDASMRKSVHTYKGNDLPK